MTSKSGSLVRNLLGSASALVQGRREILVSGFWSLALRLIGMASGFAVGVVLARSLGPGPFGIYGLVTTVAALGMTAVQLGTPQLAVRELSVRAAREDWAGAKRIVGDFSRATLLASIVIGVVALVVAYVSGASRYDLLLVGEGILLTVLMSATSLFAAELRGLGALLQGQSMDIAVRPGVTFLVILALLLAGIRLGALSALAIQIAVTFAAAIVSAIWLFRAFPARARTVAQGPKIPWLRAALPLGAVDILRQFDGSYGVILVGLLASGVELGVFRVAVACAVFSSMPITIFHILLAPTLSRLHGLGEREELQRLLSWTAAAMVAIMIPINFGAWFFAKPLISLVFGAAYQDAWLPLFLLTVAQLTYAFFGMGPILLAMCDGERDLIRIYVIAVGLALLAAVPLTWKWGGAGAGAAPIISAILIGLLSRRYARRELNVEITPSLAR